MKGTEETVNLTVIRGRIGSMTISALRGWRRKKRKTFEEFDRDFDRFINRINKRALMVKVNGASYGRAQLIHRGGRP